MAKISIAAFPKSAGTSLVWANLSNYLASFERDIIKWNNFHDTCSFNGKISLSLFADETKDCKYLMRLQNCFTNLNIDKYRYININSCKPCNYKMKHILWLLQSPFKYIATVVSASIVSKIHRFFQFELNNDGKNYRLGKLMENPAYIRFNAYWDEMAVSGFIPLLILIYLNLKIYLEVIFCLFVLSRPA